MQLQHRARADDGGSAPNEHVLCRFIGETRRILSRRSAGQRDGSRQREREPLHVRGLYCRVMSDTSIPETALTTFLDALDKANLRVLEQF